MGNTINRSKRSKEKKKRQRDNWKVEALRLRDIIQQANEVNCDARVREILEEEKHEAE